MKSAVSYAILAALLAAFLFSLSGLLARSIQAMDYWQIAGYRAIGGIAGGAFLIAVRHGRSVFSGFRFDTAVIAGAILNTVASVSFIFAILNTTVANVSIVLSTTPLLAALVAMLFIGERINIALLLLSCSASIGVSVMLVNSLRSAEFFGVAGALINVMAFVGLICLIRVRRHLDMFVAIFGGAMLTAIVSFALSPGQVPLQSDIFICLLWGGLCQTTGLALTVYAGKHVTAGEITIILMLEHLLAPLWVFLAYDERPSVWALAGGAITLCSVFAAIFTMRRMRQVAVSSG